VLAVSGIARSAQQALAWIDQAFLQQGALPPVFHPVIEEGDAEWPALRRYHLHAFRNLPYEYHNGGIWPIWLGWLALGQVQAGHHEQLPRLRREVLRALGAAPGFEFEEYLHGRTGAAGGTPHGVRPRAPSSTSPAPTRRENSSRHRSHEQHRSLQPVPDSLERARRIIAILRSDFWLGGGARLVVGVAGESGSGKSVAASSLAQELSNAGSCPRPVPDDTQSAPAHQP
jgi:hypothetical protein